MGLSTPRTYSTVQKSPHRRGSSDTLGLLFFDASSHNHIASSLVKVTVSGSICSCLDDCECPTQLRRGLRVLSGIFRPRFIQPVQKGPGSDSYHTSFKRHEDTASPYQSSGMELILALHHLGSQIK